MSFVASMWKGQKSLLCKNHLVWILVMAKSSKISDTNVMYPFLIFCDKNNFVSPWSLAQSVCLTATGMRDRHTDRQTF